MNNSLKILLISNGIFVFAGSLFVPLYALFTESIGANVLVSGFLYAIHFLSSTVVVFYLIRKKDQKLNVERMLEFNYIIRGIGWLLLGTFQNLYILFFVQIMIGISEAIGNASFNTMVSEHLDKNRHVRDWAMWDLLKNPLIALAAILSGLVVTFSSFQILFYLISFISFLAWLVLRLNYHK